METAGGLFAEVRGLHALTDGALLGLFMVSASTFGVLVFHPESPVARRVTSALARRCLMGLAMGATCVVLIASPWGRFSGAHMNPAVTLAFAALGKVGAGVAAAYIAAQVAGGAMGMVLARAVLGRALGHASVRYVATLPGGAGARGVRLAAVAELAIAFTQFFVVLLASNSAVAHDATPAIAGGMVATWIVLVAPVSGMSMNPARTLASALFSRERRGLWVYLLVPVLAMQLAARAYVELDRRVFCAKLHHRGSESCPFRCSFGELAGECVPCDAHGGERQQTGVRVPADAWCNPTGEMTTDAGAGAR